MKINIDLTTNSDFRRERDIDNSLIFGLSKIKRKFLFGSKKNVHISDFIKNIVVDIPYCISNDIDKNENGGIVQGNGSKRAFIKEVNSNQYCERCGRKKKYPWEDFSKLLCPKCEKYLESEMNTIPWRREDK